jgi:colanic acid/amylovoran biosynthesis glycosyltransferase
MNICVIVPEKGGYSETFIRAHIERLPGRVTYLYGGLFPTRLPNGDFLLPPPNFAERVRRSLLSRTLKFDFSEEKLKRKALSQFFKKNRIDAVLAEYGPTATRVMDVCQEAGVALIAHFHGYDAYETKTLEEFGEAYRKLFATADAIVAVSRHMENQLIKLGAPKENVHYNPCGMDATIFHGSDPAKAPPTFLTTGRFVDKKGPNLTLLAFAKAFAQVPQAKLIMVGDGPLLDTCMSLAQALGVAQSVDFCGPQSHDKVAQLMREARAFVQHSRVPASGDSEGTPVAISEAGGSGLPVIATRHGGIPDVIQDGITGFLVNENDVETMAERMIGLAQNPQLAAQMGRAARERILSNFTLDHTIKKLSQIIESAVSQKQR